MSLVVGMVLYLLRDAPWAVAAQGRLLEQVVATLPRPPGLPPPRSEGDGVFAAPPSGGEAVVVAAFTHADGPVYQEWPPGPLDVSVVLDAVNDQGARGIGVAFPPAWMVPEEGTLATQALRAALGGELPVVFAVEPGFSAAPSPDARTRLDQLPALVSSQVNGDLSRLPEVNDPGPATVSAVNAECLAFSRLVVPGTAEEGGRLMHVPLLARSGDRVLPALPLALWARVTGVGLDEIEVDLGREIRLPGLRVPIDGSGRLALPFSRLGREKAVPVLQLMEPDGGEVEGLLVVLGREGMPAVKAGDGREVSRAQLLAAVLSALARDDFALPLHVMQPAGTMPTLLAVLLLAVICALALFLPFWPRLASLVLVVLFWLVAVRFQASDGISSLLLPPLGAWLAGVVAGVARRR